MRKVSISYPIWPPCDKSESRSASDLHKTPKWFVYNFKTLSACARHQDCQVHMKLGWIRATAYLDMVNVLSSHDFCLRRFVKSHNSVLHRPKRKAVYLMVTEFVICGTIPYSLPWWILFTLAWKWIRLGLAQSTSVCNHPLLEFRLLNLRFLVSTT